MPDTADYAGPQRSHIMSTLVDLVAWRATDKAQHAAFTFLTDSGTQEAVVTYKELDQKARRIGGWLQSLQATGERVMLPYLPGLDYIAALLGCLYAGAIAVPTPPVQYKRSKYRVQAIAADAQPSVALITKAISSKVTSLWDDTPLARPMKWVVLEDIPADSEQSWQPPESNADTIAFLQYTSGSTSTPKGVKVSHGNIIHNQRMISEIFGQTEKSIVAGWLPLYHDMGLIGNIFQPLYLGASCILMSPVAFMQRPLIWLEAISRYKATTSGGPNFAYELCVRATTPEQRASLDLSSWSVAFNGAESVRAETMRRFADAFAVSGFRQTAFYPCYGLAEATLVVSGVKKHALPTIRNLDGKLLERNRVAEADERSAKVQPIVSCGQTAQQQQVVIVDPELRRRCSPDEVGEIWLSGPNVAQGYWNNQKETEVTFGAKLSDTNEVSFLRTGDLGFMKDGELFVTGRLKDLIVIRGMNHYPQDIELTVEQAHPSLRPGGGAAFYVLVNGEESLAVVQEMESLRQAEPDVVIDAIREAIAERHELPVYAVALIKRESLPKTSSGKVRRRACRDAFLQRELPVVAQWQADQVLEDEPQARTPSAPGTEKDAITNWLIYYIAAKKGVPLSSINPDDSIGQYGLDSLAATELMHSVETHLGAILSLSTLLESPNIAQLADHIYDRLKESRLREQLIGEPDSTTSGEFPLSFSQQSLWFMHQLAPESAAYNISVVVKVGTQLDVDALRRAFGIIVRRHPALRTTFASHQGEPVQVVHESMELGFLEEDATRLDESALTELLTQEANLPFDLAQGPLMRVTLFTRPEKEYVMLFVMHHIISDFWSIVVLVNELGVFYAAEKEGTQATLSPVGIEYDNYVRWQTERLAGPEGERLWQYWQKQLAGELPALNLPIDKIRPPVQMHTGDSQFFRISADTTKRLKELATAEGATLFMILLAGFKTLLYRYTGQQDILVGSPVWGRSRAELANIIGNFVNPVVLRSSLFGEQTFEGFLRQVRSTVLSALDHQDYPFPHLVERLQPERDPSRSPIFQVYFVLQKAHLLNDLGLAAFALGESGARMRLGELDMESLTLPQRPAAVDLTLVMAENEGALWGSIQYSTHLFEPDTISRMSHHLQNLLDAASSDPGRKISELPLLGEDEMRQVVVDWNDTGCSYPAQLNIHSLFEAQVKQSPESIAVTSGQGQLSYDEVNQLANQLARHLVSIGAEEGEMVAVLLSRSLEMIPSLLGILKAGCVYVPLEPGFPRERVQWILSSLNIRFIISQTDHIASINALQESLPQLRGVILMDKAEPAGPVDPEGLERLSARTGVCLRNKIDKLEAGNLLKEVKPNSIAYVIFTSGSTGTPKGVMVRHEPVLNVLDWVNKTFSIGRSDTLLFITSLCFDLSVYDIFGVLAAGGTIRVASDSEVADPERLVKILFDEPITFWDSAPAALQQLVPLFASVPTAKRSPHLRLVFLSGDWIPVTLPDIVRANFPRAEVISLGGATEATVWSNYYRIEVVADDWPSIPYGKPIQNARYYILDPYINACPINVEGDLYIGGKCLATGYINEPALTAEKFVPDPFSSSGGERLYKTGDRARFRADGNIQFLGRVDHQVKIRGYRIELGEIETLLNEHEDVQECIVLAPGDGSGNRQLMAYVVTRAGALLSSHDIRSHLQKKLPDYMVPSIYAFLEAMPITANGKVDRRALPPPDISLYMDEGTFVAPRTEVEEKLAQIWAEVLGVNRVGVNDNFFELGGHSLFITQIVSRIRETFGVELPLQSFFQAPTVAGLALAVADSPPVQQQADDIDRLLDFLEETPEQDLDALLKLGIDSIGPKGLSADED
jgi:amino acid adenylation domain-containing protein